MTSMWSEFRLFRASVHGKVRVANGNYIQLMGEGSVNVSPKFIVTFYVICPTVCT